VVELYLKRLIVWLKEIEIALEQLEEIA
jgi:hypothetical protein